MNRRMYKLVYTGRLRETLLSCWVPVMFLSALVPVHAGLITNGSFENTTLTGSGQATFGSGTNCTGGDIASWCLGSGGTASQSSNNGNNALSLLYFPGTEDSTVTDQFGTNNFSLWPGITNTIPNSSPDGGNYLVLDGGSGYNLSIYQTVSGLVAGKQYLLTFYQAAGQQNGFTGATTEQFEVVFGTSTQYSALQSDPSHDFQPWTKQSMVFTATSTSQVLSFLALGTPAGQPPMVFLDGINMVQTTPEPSSLVIGGIGVGALLIVRRRRRSGTPAGSAEVTLHPRP
jgi:hypothetical protein